MTPARTLLYVSPRPCAPELQAQLRAQDWEIVAVPNLRAARAALRRDSFWAALLVLDEVGRDVPLEVEACREAADGCEWVAVLPPGAMDEPALRETVLRHFFDHHTHPADARFLVQSVGHAWGRARLRHAAAAEAPGDDLGLTGPSPAVAQLRRLVRRAALADAPVLVTGEAGSGKEQVARALHACGPLAERPFTVADCGALRGEMGALLQAADGGTLLLDHVDALPLDAQARLLRLLVERAAARGAGRHGAQALPRIVAATEADLTQAVAARRFREDLFHRLHVLPLAVPPLRARKEDIPALALLFRAQCARGHAGSAQGFSREALAAMLAHAWPGNVRELANRVQRAVVMAERRTIAAQDLGLQAARPQPLDSLEASRVRAERDAISLSLDRFSHNITLAARELGVSRMTLYRLMAKHSIATRPH